MSYLEFIKQDKIPDKHWDNIENVINFIRFVAWKLNYTMVEDWYNCSRKILMDFGCGELFNRYKNIIDLLNKVYEGSYEFLEWKFKPVKSGFWDNIDNQRKYMDWLFKKLNYKNIEDWYNLSGDILESNYGTSILQKYNYTIYSILNKIYPEYIWIQWCFRQVPKNFWNIEANRINYKNWLFKKLNLVEPEGWYQLSRNIIEENKGYGFMGYYKSFENCYQSFHPHYNWIPWKFSRVPNGYWENKENRRKFTDYLFKELNYKNFEDWYKIYTEDFYKYGGGGMIQLFYTNSGRKCITELYPEYKFLQWKFICVEDGFWNDINNQKEYMDWLFKELGYTKIEDWYNLKQEHLRNNEGHGLLGLQISGESFIPNLLNKLYPEYKFFQWKFISVGPKFWNDINNQKTYMDWLFKELGYTKIEDWYKLTQDDIKNNYGAGILWRYVQINILVSNLYPEYNWDIKKFKALKGETLCNEFLESLFDKNEIKWGFYINWCRNEETGFYLPFDFCVEKYKIIIEVDGTQHFDVVSNFKNDPKENRIRDRYKMMQALKNGYSVIRILWDDIYYDTNDWKNKLKDSIHELSSLQENSCEFQKVIYLSDKYKEFEEYNIISLI